MVRSVYVQALVCQRISVMSKRVDITNMVKSGKLTQKEGSLLQREDGLVGDGGGKA